MKKLLLIALLFSSFFAEAQITPSPLYIPSSSHDLDSAIHILNVNKTQRRVYNVDLMKWYLDSATVAQMISDSLATLGGGVTSYNSRTGAVLPDVSDYAAFYKGIDYVPSWSELTGKPTIPTVPTNVSAFTNDVPYSTGTGSASGTNTGDQDLTGLVPKTTTVNGNALSGNITVSQSDIGLPLVNNTSDISKPVSTAMQNALDLKANDNAVVHNTGDETIAGTKNFTGTDLYVNNGSTGVGSTGSLHIGDGVITKSYGSAWIFPGSLQTTGTLKIGTMIDYPGYFVTRAVSGTVALSYRTAAETLTDIGAQPEGASGQTALVAGTKSITVPGVTTSSTATVSQANGSSDDLTVKYQIVCTFNTITINAITSAGKNTVNTADVSTINYSVVY